MTTRYNVYFNGNEAYKSGCKAIEKGNKDNYMEMLPLYPIGNKSTVGTGSGDFERAIEKSQKAIAVHSIKRKPPRKPGKRYTPEYKQWLARREFNPFLHNAWMLMGKHNSRKETFRKQPLLSHTSRDSTPDNPKSRQMPVFGLPNATHRWGGIMMRKMFCKK